MMRNGIGNYQSILLSNIQSKVDYSPLQNQSEYHGGFRKYAWMQKARGQG